MQEIGSPLRPDRQRRRTPDSMSPMRTSPEQHMLAYVVNIQALYFTVTTTFLNQHCLKILFRQKIGALKGLLHIKQAVKQRKELVFDDSDEASVSNVLVRV